MSTSEEKDKKIQDLEAKLAQYEAKEFKQKQAGKKRRIWLASVGFSFFFGSKLKNSIQVFFQELKQGKVSQESSADLMANIFVRLTRIGIFALIGLLIPFLFLLFQTNILLQQNKLIAEQNKKFDNQNKLVQSQNKKVEQQNKLVQSQNYLTEANRRSSLIFLFSNIMDKVDEELKVNPEKRELSPQLIGRIVALSNSFKPYKYLQGDTLSQELSPERGQLLLSLIESRLDSTTYEKIFEKASFEYADLGGANLNKTSLGGINLNKANLGRASLIEANLGGADLIEANLDGADLIKANLGGANLIKANLGGANLNMANLGRANLNMANLNITSLAQADLNMASLHMTNLIRTRLSNADLRKVSLFNARTDNINFFATLEKNECIGVEELKQKYKIIKIDEKDTNGNPLYQIVLK